jgi:hypothetical protein
VHAQPRRDDLGATKLGHAELDLLVDEGLKRSINLRINQ